MVIPWPIWDQKLQITWGLAAKKNMTIVDFRFSLFRHFGPFGGHWEKMVQLTIVTNIDFFSFDMTSRPQKHYPDLPRHHPDTLQTPSFTQFSLIEGSGQEDNSLILCKVLFLVQNNNLKRTGQLQNVWVEFVCGTVFTNSFNRLSFRARCQGQVAAAQLGQVGQCLTSNLSSLR